MHAWRLALVALGLTTAAAWHISLLWLWRDRPSVLGGVLAAVLGTVVLLRRVARATPAASRTRAMTRVARLDGVGLIFVGFLLVLVLLFHVGFDRAASDGRSYFIQVRSLVMDRDLDFANEEAVFGSHGASQYPIGAPLLWSPFYLAAHVWLEGTRLAGVDVRTDGYYYSYQRAVGLASLLYGFVGLVLAYRLTRAYFARGPAALATLGLAASSFLIWYLTVENSMVHGVSMFATTLFLFVWHRARPAPSRRAWAVLGAAAALMTLVRWQNAAVVIFPLLDLAWAARREGVRAVAGHLAAFAGVGAVVFAPQLVAWQAIFGSWLHVPTAEHAFAPSVLPPYLMDVLFSSNRGLLTWTPIVWAALAGLAVFAWRHPRVGLVLVGAFLTQLWVNASVDTWWGGAGFGARRFANCTAVFTLGLAALLSLLQRRPLLLPSFALAALVTTNGLLMLDYDRRVLATGDAATFDEIVAAAYEHVGNPFSWPMGAYLAWRYDVSPALFDRQRGRTYTDLTIDVGTVGDAPFLGHGWSVAEEQGELTYRWSDAERSTVLVPLTHPVGAYVLEVDWAPLPDAGLGPQVVSIDVNGIEVAALRLDEGYQRHTVQLPADGLEPRLNHLRFRYRIAASPESLGLSADTRALGVQLFRLRLFPAQPN